MTEPTLRKVRSDLTIWINDAPLVKTESGEVLSGALKVIVTDFGDRTKVVVTGAARINVIRSVNFRLRGYPNYRDCPEWLVRIVSQAMIEHPWLTSHDSRSP